MPRPARTIPRTSSGHRAATYPTICGTCGLAICVGDAIVRRSGGGYQHPTCAPGGDDQ